MLMSKDYYKILGVEKNSSKEDIKKAFRSLAHKHHPDKKGGDTEKFKEINEAYSVLSDDKKRSQYDQFGSGFNQSGQGGWSGQGFDGFEGFDFSGFSGGGQNGSFEFDLGDLFGDVFGGGRGRGNKNRGRDISIDLELTFSESVFGVDRSILLNKVSTCDFCGGSGAEKGSETANCSTCNGRGTIREAKRTIFGQFESTATCQTCHGSGKVPKIKCSVCHGEGILKRQSEIKVKVPSGIDNGEMIRLAGMGEATASGQSGDLYIKVHVKKHPIFRKDGNNLVMDLTIKLSDALLGAKYTIETLDGNIEVKIPEGIGHGEVLRIKNKGIPFNGRNRGDLFIKINVPFPKKLSKESKKIVEQLKKDGI